MGANVPVKEAPAAVTVLIGDIHGHYVRLVHLWERIEAAVGPEDFPTATIVFLGDFNDRGPRTKDVLEWLSTLDDRYPDQRHVYLCGNHDFSFASFIGALPPFEKPEGFSFADTWKGYEKDAEKEGWWTGAGMEDVHLQVSRGNGPTACEEAQGVS